MSLLGNSQRMRRKNFWPKAIGLTILPYLVVALAFALPWLFYVTPVFMLAILILDIILCVKRLHDTDRSGWNYLWVLLPIAGPIVLIVFLCEKGTEGPNRFGEPDMD